MVWGFFQLQLMQSSISISDYCLNSFIASMVRGLFFSYTTVMKLSVVKYARPSLLPWWLMQLKKQMVRHSFLCSPLITEREVYYIFSFFLFFFYYFDDDIERQREGLRQQWKHFRSLTIKKATLIKSIFRCIGCGQALLHESHLLY